MYLTVGEDSENVQLRVWSKALTLPHAGDNSGYKGAMAQTYKHIFLYCTLNNLGTNVTYLQTFTKNAEM